MNVLASNATPMAFYEGSVALGAAFDFYFSLSRWQSTCLHVERVPGSILSLSKGSVAYTQDPEETSPIIGGSSDPDRRQA